MRRELRDFAEAIVLVAFPPAVIAAAFALEMAWRAWG